MSDGLTAAAAKLFGALGIKGFYLICGPAAIKSRGFAGLEVERAKLLMQAQTEKDADLIRRGEASFSLQSGLHAIPNGSWGPWIEDAVRKENNLLAITKSAMEIAQLESDQPANESIHPDWMYKWRDYAVQFSDEDMRTLFAKVLAQENMKPGSYSPRALDFISKLSKFEAQMIDVLAKYVLDEWVYVGGRCNRLSPYGASLKHLLALDELGIISSSTEILEMSLNPKPGIERIDIRKGGHALSFVSSPTEPVLSIHVISLTMLGKEVVRLAGDVVDLTYFRDFALDVKEKGYSVQFGVYDELTKSVREPEAL